MLSWLIENSLVSGTLAAAAWLACRAWRLSPAVRHGLWLVVLLKLVSPPLFAWPQFSPPARFIAWLTADASGAEGALRDERQATPLTSAGARDVPGATGESRASGVPGSSGILVEYEVFEVPVGGVPSPLAKRFAHQPPLPATHVSAPPVSA